MGFLCLVCSLLLAVASVQAQPGTWRLAEGTVGPDINDIDIYHSNPDTVYAFSFYINGPTLLMSADRGEHWQRSSRNLAGGVGGNLKVDAFNSKIIFESYWLTGPSLTIADVIIDMTTDGGQTWTVASRRNVPYPAVNNFVECNPVARQTIYAGSGFGTLKRTTDRGQMWEDLPSFPTTQGPFIFLILDSDTNTFYGTSTPGGFFKSTNGGATWQQISGIGGTPTGLVKDPRNNQIFYTSVTDRFRSNTGVYKSTDGAMTWTRMNTGLSDSTDVISSIAINTKQPDEMFIATSFPIQAYRTTNGGVVWSRFDAGLPRMGHATCIAVDTLNNRIYLGTNTGIYIHDLVTSAENFQPGELPMAFMLQQNYPNPFNPSTTVQYAVPKRSYITLSVYDLLGKEVRRLVSDNKEPGNYSITFNADGLPNGIYFYRLIAGSTVLTRKAVLIK